MVGAIIELNMRRILLALVALVVVLIAIAAGIAWYATQNESFLKSQIHALVLKKTGRELAIDGLLRLDLGRETSVEAEGIRFANAAWADNPEMARIGRLRVAVDVPSLFFETPIIRLLVVEDCALDLVKNGHGEANWDLWPQAPVETRSPAEIDLPVLLLDAQIRNCRLSHTSPSREQPLRVEIRELSQQLREDRGWQIRGEGKPSASMAGWRRPGRWCPAARCSMNWLSKSAPSRCGARVLFRMQPPGTAPTSRCNSTDRRSPAS